MTSWIGALVLATSSAGGQTSKTISVDGARPVAAALDVLEEQYGVVISFEEPRIEFAGDIEDVTEQRKDLHQFPPGKAPHLIGPRDHSLRIEYAIDASGKPEDLPRTVQSIIDGEARVGAVLELRNAAGSMAVVPKKTRGIDGFLHEETPLLDTRIDLPERDRNVMELIETICEAVSKATGKSIEVGMAPSSLFLQRRIRRGASSEVAREVLRSSFAQISSRLSWRLFRDVGDDSYAFNVHLVPKLTPRLVKKVLPRRSLDEPNPFVRRRSVQGPDGGAGGQ